MMTFKLLSQITNFRTVLSWIKSRNIWIFLGFVKNDFARGGRSRFFVVLGFFISNSCGKIRLFRRKEFLRHYHIDQHG